MLADAVFRYAPLAVAATKVCLDVYMRPLRKLGPVPPPSYVFHAVDVVVGQLMALPLLPAQVEWCPHPLWLGWELIPPLPGWGDDMPPDAVPSPAALTPWLAQVAGELRMPAGDAAHALEKTIRRIYGRHEP